MEKHVYEDLTKNLVSLTKSVQEVVAAINRVADTLLKYSVPETTEDTGKVLCVYFKVIKADHCGYCSGNECEIEFDEVTRLVYEKDFPEFVSLFEEDEKDGSFEIDIKDKFNWYLGRYDNILPQLNDKGIWVLQNA